MKAKTRQQIANEYGISTKTLYRWLKRNNIQLPNTLITPNDQDKIYKAFGKPQNNKSPFLS